MTRAFKRGCLKVVKAPARPVNPRRAPATAATRASGESDPMRNFSDLSERELLALAIGNEEEDGRIYADYALALRDEYPSSAKVFEEMAAEENEHRRQLIDLFVAKFGDHIPLVRRQDIKGTIVRRPVWHIKPLSIDRVRAAAEANGVGRGALLSPRRGAVERRQRSQTARRSRRGRRPARARRRQARIRKPDPAGASGRGRGRAPALHPADHPARPRRPDGRLGVDAGAGVRRRLRDPRPLERVPGRHGGLHRRRHLDGFCRGARRRRQIIGARHAAAARPRLRADDDRRRHRPHAALSDPEFLDRDAASPASSSCSSWRPSPTFSTASWTRRRCRRSPK